MKPILIVLLLVQTAVSFAQTATTLTKEGSRVLQLHEQKFQWMIHRQTDSLGQVLDEQLQYIHSNGWIQNKKEMTEDIRSGKLVMLQVTIQDARVRIYHRSAVVTGKGLFRVVLDSKAMELTLLYTEVYVKRKQSWLLASRHANRLVP